MSDATVAIGLAPNFWDGVDPEVAEFERGLLESIDQMNRSEFARRHTPEMIAEYKARRVGRPVGSQKAKPKVPTTIRFDADVLAALRASGRGWQTRVNVADWLRTNSPV